MLEKELNYLGSFLISHNYELLLLISMNHHCAWELLRKWHI